MKDVAAKIPVWHHAPFLMPELYGLVWQLECLNQGTEQALFISALHMRTTSAVGCAVMEKMCTVGPASLESERERERERKRKK